MVLAKTSRYLTICLLILNLNSNLISLFIRSCLMKPTLRCPPALPHSCHFLRFAAAATVPFTENFTSSVSNWADGTGANLATFVTSGGPDGSSYASSTSDDFRPK